MLRSKASLQLRLKTLAANFFARKNLGSHFLVSTACPSSLQPTPTRDIAREEFRSRKISASTSNAQSKARLETSTLHTQLAKVDLRPRLQGVNTGSRRPLDSRIVRKFLRLLTNSVTFEEEISVCLLTLVLNLCSGNSVGRCILGKPLEVKPDDCPSACELWFLLNKLGKVRLEVPPWVK